MRVLRRRRRVVVQAAQFLRRGGREAEATALQIPPRAVSSSRPGALGVQVLWACATLRRAPPSACLAAAQGGAGPRQQTPKDVALTAWSLAALRARVPAALLGSGADLAPLDLGHVRWASSTSLALYLRSLKGVKGKAE